MDAVDFFSSQWAAERPGVNLEPLAVWGRFKRAASLFDAKLKEALEGQEMNLAEFEVLAALVRSGNPYEMRPTELTASLIITAGAVTARLGALERKGYISRRRDGEDRRVQLVSLSAKGLSAFEPAFNALLGTTTAILDQMDEQDRADLFTSLRAILGVMDTFELSDELDPRTPLP